MRSPTKTALFAAATAWDAAAAAALLAAAPALAAATDPKGRTALHMACAARAGRKRPGERLSDHRDADGTKTVAVLLHGGCELEAAVPMDEDEGDFRANPLWYAVARGENLPLVRFLLKRGAEASHSLWAAVWRDDAAVMSALLKAGPRLDLQAHGETPIFYAARLRRLKTLGLLIDAGADPAIADPSGRDAVAIAQARKIPAALIERLEKLKSAKRSSRSS